MKERFAELVAAARAMRARSHAPYSRFTVGAALLGQSGRIHTGANVENASFGLSICAERAAVCRAVAEGERRWLALAVAGSDPRPTPPCGACRQVLQEFAPELVVLLAGTEGEVEEWRLADLLPRAFTTFGGADVPAESLRTAAPPPRVAPPGGDIDAVDLIERKKRGEALDETGIAALIDGFTAKHVPDYQMAAWLMAVWFRGMTAAETTALTGAMLRSGAELDLKDLPGPTADKHSTGGVGDKVSLLLAPLAAACGLHVPMLSGRGLGHTGGTLDKLESVPGYRVALSNADFLRVVRDVGCAIIGQGPDIAPADGRVYALRDVTATVDCVPLITASILSKKLAAGPTNLVIDLKTGGGAFMTDLESARQLARALVGTAAGWGRRVSVLFSDMSQPLGRAVGHAVEAIEAFNALRPGARKGAPADLVALTEELTAEMVRLSGLSPDRESALSVVRRAWDGGAAWERLQRWLEAQGGRIDPEREDLGLTVAPRAAVLEAPAQGWLARVDCRETGRALGDLGGGRQRLTDGLDLTAGLIFHARLGDRLERGQPLVTLLCADAARAERARRRLAAAVICAREPLSPPPLVLERLTHGAAG